MGPSLAQIAASILVILVLTGTWRLLDRLWFRPRMLERLLRQQGFKGRAYRFLHGDLKESAGMTKQAKSRPIPLSDNIVPYVVPFLHRTIHDYGNKSFIWMGPKPRVNIQDPEHIKDALMKTNEFQRIRSSNPLFRLLLTGLASYEGDQWATHRRILNPAFHVEKLKLMTPVMYQSCNEMICAWEKMASGDRDGPCEIDVFPFLQNLTCDIIARTAFGSNYEQGKRIFHLLREQSVLVLQALQSGYLPGWRFLPTQSNKKMKANYREMEDSLMAMIKKREASFNGDDLLGLLVESNYREIQQGRNKNSGMTRQEVMEECKLFYFAGQETTSVLLVWTMILLSQHLTWQTRAREEILHFFGDRKPDFDGLNQLKVLNMILHEVLRLYPPVTALAREVHKDTRIGNVTLPAGVQIALPTIMIHHDPRIWGEDASEFNPERFAHGVAKATKNQVSFFPFGGGPWICIGLNFALVEAKMTMAMILKHFSFELGPSYTHSPHTIFTLQPQHGAHLVLTKLKP